MIPHMKTKNTKELSSTEVGQKLLDQGQMSFLPVCAKSEMHPS